MKRLIFLPLLLLLALPCYGQDLARLSAPMMGGGVAVAGGPDAWYDVNASSIVTGYGTSATCQPITVTTGGSATKIRKYFGADGATNWKCALYSSDGQSLLASGGPLAITASTGWKECTFVTPYTVSSSTVYRVCAKADDQIEFGYEDPGTADGWYAALPTYANFPEATIAIDDEDGSYTFGIYVD